MDQADEQKLLWVKDPKEVWRLATVVSQTDSEVTVSGSSVADSQVVPVNDTAIYDISHSLPLDDLSRYNNLSEAPLLQGLKKRFGGQEIYTWTGTPRALVIVDKCNSPFSPSLNPAPFQNPPLPSPNPPRRRPPLREPVPGHTQFVHP